MSKFLKWVLIGVFFIILLMMPYGSFSPLAPSAPSDNKIQTIPNRNVVAENIHVKPERETVETVARVDAEERIRFLLLGTDEREDEPSRSDTIILATYFPNEGKMNMMSIPRDTKILIDGEMQKINAAHAIGGLDLVRETVEDLTGLSIDHVAKVNFNGFKELIDEVGGVTVNPKRSFSYAGHTFEATEQNLTGEEALIYVRFRKDVDGDFGRIKRQQEVIQNTISSILSDFKLSAIPSYLSFYRNHIESDMSFGDMYHIAKTAYSNGVTLEGTTLQTTSIKEKGIWYEVVNEDEKQKTLNWLEEKPDTVMPSPQEMKELQERKPLSSGQLDMP